MNKEKTYMATGIKYCFGNDYFFRKIFKNKGRPDNWKAMLGEYAVKRLKVEGGVYMKNCFLFEKDKHGWKMI